MKVFFAVYLTVVFVAICLLATGYYFLHSNPYTVLGGGVSVGDSESSVVGQGFEKWDKDSTNHYGIRRSFHVADNCFVEQSPMIKVENGKVVLIQGILEWRGGAIANHDEPPSLKRQFYNRVFGPPLKEVSHPDTYVGQETLFEWHRDGVVLTIDGNLFTLIPESDVKPQTRPAK